MRGLWWKSMSLQLASEFTVVRAALTVGINFPAGLEPPFALLACEKVYVEVFDGQGMYLLMTAGFSAISGPNLLRACCSSSELSPSRRAGLTPGTASTCCNLLRSAGMMRLTKF
jgi:hypothetical protein